MPICGLVIRLDPDPARADEAVRSLSAHASLTLGERHDQCLPAVSDTASLEDDQALWHWLNAVEGVVHVDVVYAHVGEAGETAQAGNEKAPLQ